MRKNGGPRADPRSQPHIGWLALVSESGRVGDDETVPKTHKCSAQPEPRSGPHRPSTANATCFMLVPATHIQSWKTRCIVVDVTAAAERNERVQYKNVWSAIMEASETTAKDIEAAVDIAADITEEARQLAAELRANGKKMSERLKEFAALANRVSTAMRNTRAEVLNPSETPSSIRGLDDAGGAQPT
jgi:hypothetical protein